MTGCCSEGYCTHEIVCHGNKVAGDVCSLNEECISSFCFNGECQVKAIIFPLWVWVLIGVICVISLIMIVFGYCCIKQFRFWKQEDMRSALDHITDIHDRREHLLPQNNDRGHNLIV